MESIAGRCHGRSITAYGCRQEGLVDEVEEAAGLDSLGAEQRCLQSRLERDRLPVTATVLELGFEPFQRGDGRMPIRIAGACGG